MKNIETSVHLNQNFSLMYIKNQKHMLNGQRSRFDMCFLWKFQFLLRPFQYRREHPVHDFVIADIMQLIILAG